MVTKPQFPRKDRMDYHQNARLRIHRREQLARKVSGEKCTLKLAAASFGVSTKTAAKWVRRYREWGRAGLRDRSSRPQRMPRQTDFALVEGFCFCAASAGPECASGRR